MTRRLKKQTVWKSEVWNNLNRLLPKLSFSKISGHAFSAKAWPDTSGEVQDGSQKFRKWSETEESWNIKTFYLAASTACKFGLSFQDIFGLWGWHVAGVQALENMLTGNLCLKKTLALQLDLSWTRGRPNASSLSKCANGSRRDNHFCFLFNFPCLEIDLHRYY